MEISKRNLFTKGDILPILLLLTMRMLTVAFMMISDCDEVFNYWEPLNFLLRGFGKQTWEYSPEYSIRSWAYLLPYYCLVVPFFKLSEFLNNTNNMLSMAPYIGFYVVRFSLGTMVLVGELRLFYKLKSHFAFSSLAYWFLFFSSVSTGMTHGAVALLPSSFALCCNIYAISAILDFYFTQRMRYAFGAIFWYSLAGLLGWPFSLALALPLIFYTLGKCLLSNKSVTHALKFILGSAGIAGSILVVIVTIDSTLYSKISVVPLNIFLYNVLFADEKSGPNIFGTEPFSYYLLNLALNFNLIFFLAFMGLSFSPILQHWNNTLSSSIKSKISDKYVSATRELHSSLICLLLLPMLIWCVIFGLQPHKEERFLYPIYPIINLSAAILLFEVDALISGVSKLYSTSKIIRFLCDIVLIVVIFVISISRSIHLFKGYSAPLHVYSYLPENASGNVCVGREWYRYPSSFFLPNENTRLAFVKSGFNGLLPGDFKENAGLVESISSYPEGMNNQNLFDAGKLVDFETCAYYVDIDEDVDIEVGETRLLKNSDAGLQSADEAWEILHCEKFINSEKSSGIGRLLYFPDFLHKYIKTDLHYHNYCLLAKKDLVEQ